MQKIQGHGRYQTTSSSLYIRWYAFQFILESTVVDRYICCPSMNTSLHVHMFRVLTFQATAMRSWYQKLSGKWYEWDFSTEYISSNWKSEIFYTQFSNDHSIFFSFTLCSMCSKRRRRGFSFCRKYFLGPFFCDLALTSVIRIDHGWAGDFRCQFRNSCGLRGLDLTSTNTDSVYLSLMDNLVNLTKVRNSLSSNTAVWFFCSGKCTSS